MRREIVIDQSDSFEYLNVIVNPKAGEQKFCKLGVGIGESDTNTQFVRL